MPFTYIAGTQTRRIPGGNITGEVDLPNIQQDYTETAGATRTVYWRWNNNGTVDTGIGIVGITWTYSHDWAVTPAAGIGDDYEIRVTLDSGDTPGSGNITLSTWEALTSNQSIGLQNPDAATTKSCTLTVEIRDAATQTIQDTQVYTLEMIRT